MATQVFADEELERLREFPEIGRDELARYFILTPADAAFVDPGRGRGAPDRLGLTAALKEYGAMRRTIYAARYLATRRIGARSPVSSTKASPYMPSNATCSTRTRARCGPGTWSGRPSRPGALRW